MTAVTIRPRTDADAAEVERILTQRWGAVTLASRGGLHDAAAAPAVVAEQDGRIVGLATYVVDGSEAELLTLDALCEGEGVGSALLEAAARAASAAGADRLVLVTTNDNTRALRFYQRRGFRLVALHAGAVDEARTRKPSIPLVGEHGIAVHDELELSRDLHASDLHAPDLRGPDLHAPDLHASAGRTRPSADPVQ